MLTKKAIDNFIRHVQDYLACHHVTDALTNVTTIPAQIAETEMRRREAQAAILRTGNLLAGAVKADGRDPSAVLRVVRCADGGGGPAKLATTWPDSRVKLRELARAAEQRQR